MRLILTVFILVIFLNLSSLINNPYETYINSLHPSDIPEPFIAVKEAHSVRSVIMNVNGRNPVESVVDPGSSIITMSKEVCHELGLA